MAPHLRAHGTHTHTHTHTDAHVHTLVYTHHTPHTHTHPYPEWLQKKGFKAACHPLAPPPTSFSPTKPTTKPL